MIAPAWCLWCADGWETRSLGLQILTVVLSGWNAFVQRRKCNIMATSWLGWCGSCCDCCCWWLRCVWCYWVVDINKFGECCDCGFFAFCLKPKMRMTFPRWWWTRPLLAPRPSWTRCDVEDYFCDGVRHWFCPQNRHREAADRLAGAWNARCLFRAPTFWTTPRPVSNPSGIHPAWVGHRCFRPFWRKYFSHAPRLSPQADWMSRHPACRRWPERKKETRN